MAKLALLVELFFATCLLSELTLACKYGNPVNCHDGSYNAPQVLSVIRKGPTALARATLSNDDKLLTAATNIALGVIGEIPGGSFVAGLFNGLLGLFGGKSESEMLTDLYNNLVEEINFLRYYIDRRIEDVSVNDLVGLLGNSHSGIIGVAMKTEGKTGEDLRDALDALDTTLVTFYNNFVPRTDIAATYERTLPIFRQYGDLYVTTLVSEIALLKKLGRKDEVAKKVSKLQFITDQFDKHWEKAKNKILADHTQLEKSNCKYDSMYGTGSYGFGFMVRVVGYKTTCVTENMGARAGQRTEEKKKLKCTVTNTCSIRDRKRGMQNAKSRMISLRNRFRKTRRDIISEYWENQVGQVVDTWKKIAAKLSRGQQAYLMSLTEEERNAFAAEQVASLQPILSGEPTNSYVLAELEGAEDLFMENSPHVRDMLEAFANQYPAAGIDDDGDNKYALAAHEPNEDKLSEDLPINFVDSIPEIQYLLEANDRYHPETGIEDENKWHG